MIDTWNLMNNWNFVIPPSRPSEPQLTRVRYLASNISRSANVAVLGSTPEYRDLLYELGFKNIYCFDKNQSFYEFTSQQRIYKNSEVFVYGDWIDTLSREEFQNRFVLILSDLTSGNIPYSIRAHFYEGITKSLIKGGYFFDKILTHPSHHLPVDDLITKYSKLPLNLVTVNHFSCEMLFCSELLDINYTVDSSLFYETLVQQTQNLRVRLFAEQAKLITPPGTRWYYGKRWKELEPDYCPRLKSLYVEDDEYSSPYYRRLMYNLFTKS